MVTELIHNKQTFTSGQDLSSYQYRFVKLSTDGKIDPCGAGERSIGVLQNKATAVDRACTVATMNSGNRSKVVAGGVVSVGDDVTPDSSARAVVAATGDYIGGTALTAAAAAGEYITVDLVDRQNVGP